MEYSDEDRDTLLLKDSSDDRERGAVIFAINHTQAVHVRTEGVAAIHRWLTGWLYGRGVLPKPPDSYEPEAMDLLDTIREYADSDHGFTPPGAFLRWRKVLDAAEALRHAMLTAQLKPATTFDEEGHHDA
jgi:hypothetical protein